MLPKHSVHFVCLRVHIQNVCVCVCVFTGRLTIRSCEVNGHGEVNLGPEKTRADYSLLNNNFALTVSLSLSLSLTHTHTHNRVKVISV